jgi:hypothetical protein
MNLKKLNAIIPIVSVGVMIVWGILAKDWSKSWLAVFVGGILMAVLNIMGRNKDDGGKK